LLPTLRVERLLKLFNDMMAFLNKWMLRVVLETRGILNLLV